MYKILKPIQFQSLHIKKRTNNALKHVKRQKLNRLNLQKHHINNNLFQISFTTGLEHLKQNLFQRLHIKNNFHKKHKNKRTNGKNNIAKNYYNYQNILIQWNTYKTMTNLHNKNNNNFIINIIKTDNKFVLDPNKFQISLLCINIKYNNYNNLKKWTVPILKQFHLISNNIKNYKNQIKIHYYLLTNNNNINKNPKNQHKTIFIIKQNPQLNLTHMYNYVNNKNNKNKYKKNNNKNIKRLNKKI